jgi:arsenate reductase (thioredoxin)
MSERPIRVIFVCTGNSARSQMAEAILRREGGADFEVVSAGVAPKPIHPLTIRALAEAGIDIGDAHSKSIESFIGQPFDYVVTVCDRARESCPVFPGAGESLHWGFDDPAEATGTEAERLAVFRRVMTEIAGRINAFVEVTLRTRDEARIGAR